MRGFFTLLFFVHIHRVFANLLVGKAHLPMLSRLFITQILLTTNNFRNELINIVVVVVVLADGLLAQCQTRSYYMHFESIMITFKSVFL